MCIVAYTCTGIRSSSSVCRMWGLANPDIWLSRLLSRLSVLFCELQVVIQTFRVTSTSSSPIRYSIQADNFAMLVARVPKKYGKSPISAARLHSHLAGMQFSSDLLLRGNHLVEKLSALARCSTCTSMIDFR
jgi:hypothetical protein